MAAITNQQRRDVIEKLASVIQAEYVFADKGTVFAGYVLKRLEAGMYDTFSDEKDLASRLTDDLQGELRDRHLAVIHDVETFERLQQEKEKGEEDSKPSEEWLARLRRNNYEFKRVERLRGNIGLIRFDMFAPAEYAGETAIAAMQFVANCDALIFDLRRNGGGWPSLIQLITTYLFDESKHLNNFYTRTTDSTQQFWTLTYVPGKRMVNIPVYVLTSSYTFSGAEEFSYNLRQLERGTLVGETTGGGAHPVSAEPLAAGFFVRVCKSRAVNPITGTNWEGVGVEPHISVPAEQALEKAHLHALETLLEHVESDEEKARIRWEIEMVKTIYSPVAVSEDELQRFVGNYAPYTVEMVNGGLAASWRGFTHHLTPLGDNRFVNLDWDEMQFEFLFENGAAPAHALKISELGKADDRIVARQTE